MSNQRAIAAELGVNQATVSLALRGHPSIPEETRRRVEETARRLGYQKNAYVASLMARIRSGRPVAAKGCIAILMDAESPGKSLAVTSEIYRRQHAGMLARAAELGFSTECFYLRAAGMSARKIDRILEARGITGVVLAAPKSPSDALGRGSFEEWMRLSWERYALSTVAWTWRWCADTHRVATDYRDQIDVVFEALLRRGYRRIGVVLPELALNGRSRVFYWQYLLREGLLETKRGWEKQRVPVFLGRPGETALTEFAAWFRRVRPDAIVCQTGMELEWLEALGCRVPEEVGLVCVNRPIDSMFSGLEENFEEIGAMAVELVANQIIHNEHGLPQHPRTILIKGRWVEGKTVRMR
ncbi:LacI family DNA-binding transcriptional regulator [Geminisphaera colitermitum]|uniref:substrate-binding domain-containing protein n=1 Tax=Geminisphaera colitermitum TaxID=1148786 RepID=UPI0006939317|nr:LacI family DNA-binding transcriptional regulator [Geminisphaera colitermitum]